MKLMPVRLSGRLVPKSKRELPSFVQVLSIHSVDIAKVRPAVWHISTARLVWGAILLGPVLRVAFNIENAFQFRLGLDMSRIPAIMALAADT